MWRLCASTRPTFVFRGPGNELKTTPQALIDEYTAKGWWGQETLVTLFERALANNPQRVALIDPPNRSAIAGGDAHRLTYSELERWVEATAATLHATGVRADDIIVVQLPNVVELAVAYLALARLGAITSPVPVQYGLHELNRIREELPASGFLSLGSFRGRDLAAAHAPAFKGCGLYTMGSPSAAAAIDVSEFRPSAHQQKAYLAYREAYRPDANDILTICWTSGTTGRPKGVPRSTNHWLAITPAAGDLAELRDGDVLLNPFPMVNMGGIGGFLFNWLKCQGTLVLHHPMDLPVFLNQLQAEKINYTIAPPPLLNTLLRDEQLLANVNLTHLRAIGSGSAPLPSWMIQGYEERYGIAILNNFGSNEGMCLASGPTDVPDPALRGELFPRFGVEGYDWRNGVAAMVETRLIDPDTGNLIDEPGIPGELLFKGPTIFDGYWRSPETNAQVFTEDGFFRTGDLFMIAGPTGDPRYYRFVGRLKDIIARGGMKISPAELDGLLAGHPKIADVAVFGVPDPILGERVAAAVVAKPGEVVVLEDVIDYLKAQNVAAFKFPESLYDIEELPRNPLGKVLRHELATLVRVSNQGAA